MITPDFCGAYDGLSGIPLTDGPRINLAALLANERPAGSMLFATDEDEVPAGTEITAECVLVLSATRPLPIPDEVIGHAVAAMDQGLAVYVVGATREDTRKAISHLIGLAGGGHT